MPSEYYNSDVHRNRNEHEFKLRKEALELRDARRSVVAYQRVNNSSDEMSSSVPACPSGPFEETTIRSFASSLS